MKKPAILGGSPAFDQLLPINQPTLPKVDDLTAELTDIFNSGMLTNARYVKRFENECADYLEVKNAVAVSCCTSGLLLSLKLLGLKGEVIVPSFTFPATVHALLWNNLKPVFVDCDPETFNIDPHEVEKKITPQTCAIMLVYIFGNPPQLDRLTSIAAKHHLKMISDAAHALGVKYHGKFAGNFADAEVFSLAPTKLVVAGEGGIVATNNDQLAADLKIARDYGNPGNYNTRFIGLNARMSEMHALLAGKCLTKLEESINTRYKLVDLYKSRLQKLPGISFQKIEANARTSYNYFSVLVDEEIFGLNNDQLSAALKPENIMTRKYFYPPVHEQDAYKDYYQQYQDQLPATAWVCKRICCLPLFTHLPEEKVIKVCEAIERIYENRVQVKGQIG
ncbi:MAG: DegT/DnrJ/EryC1/StrS family aminotransferase [Candidatus Schekmanbacteria bacterium]|nr:DegT/DnrJ/EryC1/StrS family aminotransferase [Candidatus Schekmanbacteria bacterium]